MKKALQMIMALIFFSPVTSFSQEIQAADSSTSVSSGNIKTVAPVKQRVYKIKYGIDIPLTVVGDGWSLYGMSVIYGRDPIPESEINALDRNNVNNIDRFVTKKYSESAADASNYFFYGSMPLPLVLLLDRKIRKDGLKIGMLYLEAVGITGGLYVASAMIADRHRPYTYNPKAPMTLRTRGGARNSFFAGHVAVVATSVFLTAQVFVDYHPEMKHKWMLYTGAALLATTTGVLRIEAGQHFLTDVATGLTVGTLSGLLVPYIHKIKGLNNSRLTILPNIQQSTSGITFLYKLDKKRYDSSVD